MLNRQILARSSSGKNSLATIFFVFEALHIYSLIKSGQTKYFQFGLRKVKIGNNLVAFISMGFCLSFICVEVIQLF